MKRRCPRFFGTHQMRYRNESSTQGGIEMKRQHVALVKRPPVSAYEVTAPETYREGTFMLKDSKRFPKTNGWWYASFRDNARADTFKAFGDVPEFANTCQACHTAFVKARD